MEEIDSSPWKAVRRVFGIVYKFEWKKCFRFISSSTASDHSSDDLDLSASCNMVSSVIQPDVSLATVNNSSSLVDELGCWQDLDS